MKKIKLFICAFLLISCTSYSMPKQSIIETYVSSISKGDFQSAASVVNKKQLKDFHQFFIDLAKPLDEKGKYSVFTSGFLAKYSTFESLKQEDPISFFANLLSFSEEMLGIPTQNIDGCRFVGTVKENNQKAYAVVVFTVTLYNQRSDMPVLIPLVLTQHKTTIATHPISPILVKGLPTRMKEQL